MSFELIAVAVVAFGFGAIAVRFIPRDEHGSPRLPRIVDESVGMWALRRVLGRPTEPRATTSASPLPQPTADEIAWRIGAPGAAPPMASSGDVPGGHGRATRLAAVEPPRATLPSPAPPIMPAAAPERRSPLPPAELVARATAILERQPPPRPSAPPRSALAVQRRVAIVATFLFAAASIAALALSARDLESGVLSVTGSPEASPTTTASPAPSGDPEVAASPAP